MRKNEYIVLFVLLIGFYFFLIVPQVRAESKVVQVLGRPVFTDSLLKKLSVDDLLKLESSLNSQLDSTAILQHACYSKAIGQGTEFLKNNTSPEYRALVLNQLGDIYRLLAEQAETDSTIEAAYNRATDFYTMLIAECPEHNAAGNALFALAELKIAAGEDSSVAIPALKQLVADYPKNENIPAAYFWIAEELWFAQHDAAAAESLYRKILNYQESREYLPTLYQLARIYQQTEKYPDCIRFYSRLLQAIPQEGFSLRGRHVRLPGLEEELAPLLARVFYLADGLDTWQKWQHEYDWADFGFDVLAEMGAQRLRHSDADGAFSAYELWLRQSSMADNAPIIFRKLIQAAEAGAKDAVYLFDLRENFVESYGPDSEWWQEADAGLRDKTSPLVASAHRENIQWLELQGVLHQKKSYFSRTARDYKTYFRLFPQDSSLDRMHWNFAQLLENRLGLPDSAYSEYLRLAENFWDSSYQQKAVEQAIQVAATNMTDSVLQAELRYPRELIRSLEPVGIPEIAAVPFMEVHALTKWEKRYHAAIDMYIMLYPHDLETADKLLRSGILNFRRGRPGQALKYARTMNYYFPHSSLADVATLLIIESGFQQQQWPETIAECRRIMRKRDAGDLGDYARLRFAEASYFQALALADSGNLQKAAAGFASIITFVPDIAFADIALLNAGELYADAREYRRALSMFSRLMQQYEDSENYFRALDGSIFCYEQMEQYRNAAQNSELLAKRTADPGKAADALQKAGLFYEKAKQFTQAIRVYRDFAARFPHAENTAPLLLSAGELALSIGKSAQADTIFLNLTNLYPVHTAAVAGNYYLGQLTSELDSAKILYANALQLFETLSQDEKENVTKFAVDSQLELVRIAANELQTQLKTALPDSFGEIGTEIQKIISGYDNAARLDAENRFEINFHGGEAILEVTEIIANHVSGLQPEIFVIDRRLEIADYAIQLAQQSFVLFLNNLAYLALFLPDSLADSSDQDAEITSAGLWQDRSREKAFQALAKQIKLKQKRLEWNAAHVLKIADLPTARFQILHEKFLPMAQDISHDLTEGMRLSRRWQVKTADTQWMAEQQTAAALWYPTRLWQEIHGAIRFWKMSFEQESSRHFQEDNASVNLGTLFGDIQRYAAPETVVMQYDSLNAPGPQLSNLVKNVCLLSAELDSTIQLVRAEEFELRRQRDVLGNTDAGNRAAFCREQLISLTEFKNNWLETAARVNGLLPDTDFWQRALLQELVYAFPEDYAVPLAVDTVTIDSNWFVTNDNSSRWRYPIGELPESLQLAVIDSLSGNPVWGLIENGVDSTKAGKPAESDMLLRYEFSGHGRPINMAMKLYTNTSVSVWLNGAKVPLKRGEQDNFFEATIFSGLFPEMNIICIELSLRKSVKPFIAEGFKLSYISDPQYALPAWRSAPVYPPCF